MCVAQNLNNKYKRNSEIPSNFLCTGGTGYHIDLSYSKKKKKGSKAKTIKNICSSYRWVCFFGSCKSELITESKLNLTNLSHVTDP